MNNAQKIEQLEKRLFDYKSKLILVCSKISKHVMVLLALPTIIFLIIAIIGLLSYLFGGYPKEPISDSFFELLKWFVFLYLFAPAVAIFIQLIVVVIANTTNRGVSINHGRPTSPGDDIWLFEIVAAIFELIIVSLQYSVSFIILGIFRIVNWFAAV